MVTTATRRGVGYFRVSTANQTGERHSSLETQEARYKDYCQQNGIVQIAMFTDVLSGRRDDRKEYSRMVEFALSGGADVVVVQFLDRFGRNPKEILRRYWQLQDYGVEIVTTDEDLREELMLLIRAGIAGAESKRTSERVRANMMKVVSKGVHAGNRPYGLKPIKDVRGGKLATVAWEHEPQEATLVRQMYHLIVGENLGYKRVADRLNEAGYRGRNGNPFASYIIQTIVNNEAIMGTLAYGKRPRKGNPKQDVIRIPGFFPPILSKEEWDRLQGRLAIRRESPRGRTHSSPYLLSGIARCGHCGGPLVSRLGYKKRGKTYRYYRCSRALRAKEYCAYLNNHPIARLEKAILEYFGEFSNPERVREILATTETQAVDTRQAELATVMKRLDALDKDFLANLGLLKKGLLEEDEFRQANDAKRTEKEQLKARKVELETWLAEERDKDRQAADVPVKVRAFLEDFQAADIRVQKAQLQTILKAAYVYRDGRIELEFRD